MHSRITRKILLSWQYANSHEKNQQNQYYYHRELSRTRLRAFFTIKFIHNIFWTEAIKKDAPIAIYHPWLRLRIYVRFEKFFIFLAMGRNMLFQLSSCLHYFTKHA